MQLNLSSAVGLAVAVSAGLLAGGCGLLGDGGDGLDGAGEEIDPTRLDRSVALGTCGYPGAGAGGYGTEVGERIANFGHVGATEIIDCEGNPIEFADILCPRSDYQAEHGVEPSAYSGHNKAVVLSIGAGWCEPCVEETEEMMAKVYDPLYEEGLEIVQVLFQDDAAQAPTKSFCRDWRDDRFDPALRYFVLLDQSFGWADEFLLDPQASTPVTMLIDANANIRYKVVGQKPKNLADEARLVMANPYGD